MTVVKVYKNRIKDLNSNLINEEKEMLSLFALCTDASISYVNGEKIRVGDPTETALIDANNKFGLYPKDNLNFEKVTQLSFDSNRKMMSVVVKYNGRLLSITKDRKSTRLNSSHVRISYAVF